MATKTTKQIGVENGTYKVLGLMTKANNCALNTTEKVFDTSFKIAHKSMDITHKVFKKGLDITATQQDLFFDVLQRVKKRVVKD